MKGNSTSYGKNLHAKESGSPRLQGSPSARASLAERQEFVAIKGNCHCLDENEHPHGEEDKASTSKEQPTGGSIKGAPCWRETRPQQAGASTIMKSIHNGQRQKRSAKCLITGQKESHAQETKAENIHGAWWRTPSEYSPQHTGELSQLGSGFHFIFVPHWMCGGKKLCL